MKTKRINVLMAFVSCLLNVYGAIAQEKYDAVYSGTSWFDDHGNIFNAHAAGIIRDKNRYYLFGERHSDTSKAFNGFNCYSSTDLYNWKFESLALPVQDSGRLGPNRRGERVKVLKCPQTGEYVMYMHTDDLLHKDQYIGYATSNAIAGPYTFKGVILFNGQPIRKWDMGTFQDNDGSGYILIHGGEIYKLASDYKSVTEQVAKNIAPNSESPAVFKKGNLYYWLGSSLTSWERNDNFYYTAATLKGPWTAHGNFAPKGTLTWNSQTTFVLPIEGSKDTTFMFMGDRWSFPHQASAATYIWQPITFIGNDILIPKLLDKWQIDVSTGVVSSKISGSKTVDCTDSSVKYVGQWQMYEPNAPMKDRSSDVKNTSFSIKFNGKQIGFYGSVGPNGGYAKLTITDSADKVLLSNMVDMYCNYPTSALKFMSPVFTKGEYKLTVTVMGEHGNWADKKRSDYGSKGNFVSIEKLTIN